MLIGITYDLKEDYLAEGYNEEEVAEFDAVETIDAINQSIQKLGFQTEKIGNVKNLIKKLNEKKRWDIVFNICEGLYGLAREALVPSLLDAYKIPYFFSDPLVLSLTLHKGLTKTIVKYHNLPTPDFIVINSISDLNNFSLDYPLFVKPVAEGTGKGINSNSIVFNKKDLLNISEELLKKFNQPVLIEKYLKGREFTVGIVGNDKNAKVVGIMEIIYKENADKNIYSFKNKKNYLDVIEYKVPEKLISEKCSELALKIYKVLNCKDCSRIDIRCDSDDEPYFLEINPLPGLHPIDSDLPILCSLNKIDYDTLIKMIVKSGLERLKIKYNFR
ncbi:MAG TPA: ATP-grasp domain-containing protein [bacterium]|nr:ATP-grasp domain-containing protein [bacterium]HOL46761.1 ATP-grasp domain-containing protein [bacterium]HPQ18197.1 ATP-grasp domain-containing protein [bacterium]